MINLAVHAEFLRKGAADPFTGAFLPTALIVGVVLAAMLIGVIVGNPQTGSSGETVAARTLVNSPGVGPIQRAAMKIVPADALGTQVSRSP